MNKYIVRVDEPVMLHGVAACVEDYHKLPNSKKHGIGSVSIYRMDDGRDYTVVFSRYKSGTFVVDAYTTKSNGDKEND